MNVLIPQIEAQLAAHQHDDYTTLIGLDEGSLEGFYVARGVMRPEVMSSVWLARYLSAHADLVAGRSVLDMGCGTGIQGIVMGVRGAAHIWFSDICPECIANTKINIRTYGIESRSTITVGDLFDPIPPAQTFDLIVFNHPFFPSDVVPADSLLKSMIADEGLIHRFFDQARDRSGRIVMPFFHPAGKKNNPALQGPRHGYSVTELEHRFVDTGLQVGDLSIYSIGLPAARIDVGSELEKARQNLLDLTMRNRLLNYRQTGVRSIRVTGQVPAEIYETLVLREKTLEFRGTGIRRESAEGPSNTPSDQSQVGVHLQAEEWRSHAAEDLESQHTDRYLATPYDDESLEKKLFRVYHEGHSAVEEQGYTVVHLALGFLEWFEAEDAQQPRRAPLILVPVELERVRAGDFSKVKWTGEEVFANISLTAKLVEQGVALPAFDPPEEKSGIDAWLQQVVDAIAKKPGWRVLSEMGLDFFSFTKFVMFKDLDPSTWPEGQKAEDHPLLQSLFNPRGAPLIDDGFDERDIDKKLTARDLWHVRDADPSQIAVIEDVKAGRDLVVQGPPGTGKSQTITNLVAEALAAGKTVLFVSEKMAALEVVKSRLDEAGLGPFCLELHSRKANKKAVLSELQRALSSQALPPASDRLLEEHELLKNELNHYASELGMPVGKLARTPFQLVGEKQQALSWFEAAKRTAPPMPVIAHAEMLGDDDVATAMKALRELAYAVPLVRPASAHPWRHSTLETMLPHQESELRDALWSAESELQLVVTAAADLATASGAQEPSRLTDIERALRAADVIARAPSAPENALLLNAEWNAPNQAANALVARAENCQRESAQLANLFGLKTIDTDLGGAVDEFRPLASSFFRIFNGRYRALRKQFAARYVIEVPGTAQMAVDLGRLVAHQRSRGALRKDASGQRLFGSRWRADASDCAELRTFAEWIVGFRHALVSNVLTDKAVEIAASEVDAPTLQAKIDRLRRAASKLREQLDALTARIQLDVAAAFGEPIANLSFEQIGAALRLWNQRTSDLFRWVQFNAARKALRGTAAEPIEPFVIDDRLDEGDVLPFFRAALAESLLRTAFSRSPALGTFVGDLHEKKIARFREIDASLVKLNQARLSRRLHERRPQISGGASKNSEVGILLGEFNRRRAHMPIRKLLSTAGGLIQRIKPCFLMSPLSIAQFLNPRGARFDLIVFDEGSQVRPEDALGALLRGNQIVVMGDTQQLPPTSFFDHLTESDEEPIESDEPQSASVTDVESILHQCARSYETKMLNWHYRSKHESLIAVSNLHFYDNRLHIYPSAIDWADEIGLHFVHIPHSVYDRGKSSTNRIEAQTVAAAAVHHYRRFPEKSLGTGTFNIKQQQAILEEIELQLKAHPEMEPFFKSDRHEHFFVKNLETIQGDERDVIMISVGYGRDAAGKLSMNFGPVNRDGGERRLNVLMTRAREKCVVFSNFTASDLPVESTASKGIVTLKSFLEYAQSRHLTLETLPQDDTDSPFEDAVAEVLRGQGHEVRQQVGCAGFRVDLAVVDPDERGRYLLGIECDGAKYHSSPVARDRDRLRQQILEKLGWTIHRVWSTDWYRNRTETIDRLLRAVEAARRMPRKFVASPRAPETSHVSSLTAHEYEEEHIYDDATTELPPNVIPDGAEARHITTKGGSVSEESTIGAFTLKGLPHDDIPEYQVCRSLRIPTTNELHEAPPEQLAIAVEDVVRIESPVHVDEVVRRIRTIWGLRRTGNRIREAIERGIRITVARRVLEMDADFLRLPNTPTPLRRRNGDPPARIELISDAEIGEAIKHVLRAQFATSREDLITTAARRLGIQATTSMVSARVDKVVSKLALAGDLVQRSDGLVELQ